MKLIKRLKEIKETVNKLQAIEKDMAQQQMAQQPQFSPLIELGVLGLLPPSAPPVMPPGWAYGNSIKKPLEERKKVFCKNCVWREHYWVPWWKDACAPISGERINPITGKITPLHQEARNCESRNEDLHCSFFKNKWGGELEQAVADAKERKHDNGRIRQIVHSIISVFARKPR